MKGIISILALALSFLPAMGETAAGVLQKAAHAAQTAKGINGTFRISQNGQSVNGTFKSTGSKFSLLTPQISTWYNGKNMWTYNASSAETMLTVPTKEEISESNPLEYLKSYNSTYTPSFSKKKMKGKYLIVLTPKSKRNAIKSIEVTINSASWKPEKFVVTGSGKSVTTITVVGLNYNVALNASAFEYPKSKYPKVQIVDLR